MKFVKWFLVAICFALVAQPLQAKRIYVRLSTDTEAWKHITADANSAVVAVAADWTDVLSSVASGDEVWIAKGVYNQVNQVMLDFPVKFYGGFYGDENLVSDRKKSDIDSSGAVEPWEFTHQTVLSGRTLASKAYHFFTFVSSGDLVDGVVMENYEGASNGGAVLMKNQTSEVRNCIIRNINVTASKSGATAAGGAIYATPGNVYGCLIESCSVKALGSAGKVVFSRGGALFMEKGSVVQNSIIRNSAAKVADNADAGVIIEGGGLVLTSGAMMENCLVYNNYSAGKGGGVQCEANAVAPYGRPSIYHSTIVNNKAKGNGAGICVNKFGVLYNSVIWGNTNDAGVLSPVYFEDVAGSVICFDYYAVDGQIVNANLNKITSVTSVELDESNEGSGAPQFKIPTTIKGCSTNSTDESMIKSANWSTFTSSPLVGKGVATVTAPPAPYAYTFLAQDLIGLNYNSPRPLGCYEASDATATALIIEPASMSLYLEESEKAVARLIPAVADPHVEWYSRDSSIATVDETGVVTAVKEGTVKIVAKYGSVEAECTVTCISTFNKVVVGHIGQNDVEFSWKNSSYDGSYNVVITDRSDKTEVLNIKTAEQTLYYNMLLPSSRYTITVKALGSNGEVISTITEDVMTAYITSAYPRIGNVKGEYTAKEEMTFYALDISDQLTSVVWKLDGEQITPPRVVPTAGAHTLTLEYQTKGEKSEKIIKYINVK